MKESERLLTRSGISRYLEDVASSFNIGLREIRRIYCSSRKEAKEILGNSASITELRWYQLSKVMHYVHNNKFTKGVENECYY